MTREQGGQIGHEIGQVQNFFMSGLSTFWLTENIFVKENKLDNCSSLDLYLTKSSIVDKLSGNLFISCNISYNTLEFLVPSEPEYYSKTELWRFPIVIYVINISL